MSEGLSTSISAATQRRSTWLATFREPVFAELLRHRAAAAMLALLAAAQIITAARRVVAVVCPLPHLFGIPCPACGLTRGTVYLTVGYWRQAMIQHAFSPVVVAGLLLLVLAAILPARLRDKLCLGVEYVERRTGAVFVLFALLIVYWLVRLAVCPGVPLKPLEF